MGELPTGTVTFLFTDLERSTELWEAQPQAMQAALARHDELLAEAVEAHGGRVVKGTGDGLHAVFSTACEAVAAVYRRRPYALTRALKRRPFSSTFADLVSERNSTPRRHARSACREPQALPRVVTLRASMASTTVKRTQTSRGSGLRLPANLLRRIAAWTMRFSTSCRRLGKSPIRNALQMATARAVVCAVVVVAAQSPGAAAAETPRFRRAERVSGWQSEVEPIARAVERLRGERFTKPVRVHFLADTEFDQRAAPLLQQSPASAHDLEVSAGLLRALGYTNQTNDELRSIPETVNVEALGAFYDPRSADILTRRSHPSVLGEVFLAHELTHALDDQIADLTALSAAVSSAQDAFVLRALLEGDATYIMGAYLETLSPESQASFFNEQRQFVAGARERLANFPAIVVANSAMPYTLGEWLPALVAAERGGHAISDVFDHLPKYGIQFLDPTTYVLGIHGRHVQPPRATVNETRLRTTQFGAASLFLLLSSRIDPQIALTAAEDWRGGAQTVLNRNGRICARLEFSGQNAAATAEIGAAFDQWSATMPAQAFPANAKTANKVTVTTCDPGDAAMAPRGDAEATLGIPIVRNALLTRAVVDQRARLRDAKCAADRVVETPGTADAIAQGHLAELFVIPPEALDNLAAGLADSVANCRDATPP